ncbi:hypothetical protein GWI33_012269 [Rhynchophorus ferrugineus]|uniref:Uncharacterized protein n=1 Tax=Rhynchophorus ferrugineus TaxID=354439 RepID=A0A834I8H7_RHYFE|nr:hypothetical protein GWI33_012269 [Rhynchophorus ferrugineus]
MREHPPTIPASIRDGSLTAICTHVMHSSATAGPTEEPASRPTNNTTNFCIAVTGDSLGIHGTWLELKEIGLIKNFVCGGIRLRSAVRSGSVNEMLNGRPERS